MTCSMLAQGDDVAAEASTSVAAALTPRVWTQIGRLPIPRFGCTREGFAAWSLLRDGRSQLKRRNSTVRLGLHPQEAEMPSIVFITQKQTGTR